MADSPLYDEGELVEALWQDNSWYKAVIEYETDNGWCVTFPDRFTLELPSDRIRKIKQAQITNNNNANDNKMNSSNESQGQGIAGPPWMALNSSIRNGTAIVLLSGEINYVNELQSSSDVFVTPLGKNLEIMNSPLRELFAKFQFILTIHQQFLVSLRSRLIEWVEMDEGDRSIGDLFSEFAPYFKLYAEYCALYESSSLFISNKLNDKNSFLSQFCLKNEANKTSQGKTIRSTLTIPLERLLNYEIFLQDFINQTSALNPNHKDLPALKSSMETVANLLKECSLSNAMKNGANMSSIYVRYNSDRIHSIDSLFSPPASFSNNNPPLTLIRHGMLTKKRGQEFVQYHVFLFSNMIVCAYPNSSGSSESLKLESSIPISSSFKVNDLPNPNVINKGVRTFLEESVEQLHRFLIESGKDVNGDDSTIFYASTLSEKLSWISDLQKLTPKMPQPKSSNFSNVNLANAISKGLASSPMFNNSASSPKENSPVVSPVPAPTPNPTPIMAPVLPNSNASYSSLNSSPMNRPLAPSISSKDTLSTDNLTSQLGDVLSWSVDDVASWLGSGSVSFPQYVPLFREFMVDGMLLSRLTEDDLKNDLQVTSSLHRKRLLTLIEKAMSNKSPALSTSNSAVNSTNASPSSSQPNSPKSSATNFSFGNNNTTSAPSNTSAPLSSEKKPLKMPPPLASGSPVSNAVASPVVSPTSKRVAPPPPPLPTSSLIGNSRPASLSNSSPPPLPSNIPGGRPQNPSVSSPVVNPTPTPVDKGKPSLAEQASKFKLAQAALSQNPSQYSIPSQIRSNSSPEEVSDNNSSNFSISVSNITNNSNVGNMAALPPRKVLPNSVRPPAIPNYLRQPPVIAVDPQQRQQRKLSQSASFLREQLQQSMAQLANDANFKNQVAALDEEEEEISQANNSFARPNSILSQQIGSTGAMQMKPVGSSNSLNNVISSNPSSLTGSMGPTPNKGSSIPPPRKGTSSATPPLPISSGLCVCGAKNNPSFKFCLNCGAKLNPVTPMASSQGSIPLSNNVTANSNNVVALPPRAASPTPMMGNSNNMMMSGPSGLGRLLQQGGPGAGNNMNMNMMGNNNMNNMSMSAGNNMGNNMSMNMNNNMSGSNGSSPNQNSSIGAGGGMNRIPSSSQINNTNMGGMGMNMNGMSMAISSSAPSNSGASPLRASVAPSAEWDPYTGQLRAKTTGDDVNLDVISGQFRGGGRKKVA